MAARKKKVARKPAAKKGGVRKPASARKVTKKVARPVAEDSGLVRLNKYLADHGVDSRRKCDELIREGKVVIDGAPVTELGTKIDPAKQTVEVDGIVLKPEKVRRRYYLLNKPSGVVCTNERRELRPRAIDLITDTKKGRIYTIGRLDEESKGLILLTNDGEYANRVMHPRYGVKKTYLVKVRGKIDDEALNKVRNGIHLSEGRTSGARILVQKRTKDYTKLAVTLIEGMNREIRRTFARVGYKVVDLQRVRIGPLTLTGMKRAGKWRELSLMEAWSVVDEVLEDPESEVVPQRRANRGGAAARRKGIVSAADRAQRKKKPAGRKVRKRR